MSGIFLLIKRKMVKNKKHLLLTIIALVLGISLLISIQSAVQNTKDKFNDVMNKQTSSADIVLKSVSNGLMEEDVSFLNDIENIRSYLPRFEIRGLAFVNDENIYINVIGMLPEEEYTTGSFQLDEGLMPKEGEILLPVSVRDKYNLKIGDQFEIDLQDKHQNYLISGFVKTSGIASSQNGNVCIMQLKTVEDYFDTDKVTSINIILNNTTKRDATLSNIESKLTKSTVAFFPERKNDYVIETMKGFFLGLKIFSLITFLAGGFIIFNTISKFIADEKAEIAVLKVMGFTRKKIYLYILMQTAILSIISLIIGVIAGILLTGIITNVVMQSAAGISYFSMKTIGIKTLIKDIIFVFCINIVSSLIPASNGARISIIEGLFTVNKKEKQHDRFFLAVIIISVIALVLSIIFGRKKEFFIFELIIFSIVFSYSMLYIIVKPFTSFINKIFNSGKRIYAKSMVKTNLLSNKFRTANTAFSSGICIALAVTILGVSSGFKVTLSNWMDSMYPGDVVAYSRLGLDDDMISGLCENENISEVVESYSISVFDNEESIELQIDSLSDKQLSSNLFSKHLKYNESIEKSFDNSDEIIMSKKIASKLKIDVGDTYTLRTELGETKFNVVGLADSFLGEENKCFISINNFKKFYSQKKLVIANIFLKESCDVKQVMTELSEEFRDVEFTSMNEEIESQKQLLSNNLFTAFYALVFVSMLISGICLMNSMNMFIADMTYQISILKCLGMTKKKMKRLIYTQGEILGSLSIFLGVFLGIALQYIATRATEYITGWKIDFRLNVLGILLVILIGFIVSLCASIIPATLCYKVNAIEELRKGEN